MLLCVCSGVDEYSDVMSRFEDMLNVCAVVCREELSTSTVM